MDFSTSRSCVQHIATPATRSGSIGATTAISYISDLHLASRSVGVSELVFAAQMFGRLFYMHQEARQRSMKEICVDRTGEKVQQRGSSACVGANHRCSRFGVACRSVEAFIHPQISFDRRSLEARPDKPLKVSELSGLLGA